MQSAKRPQGPATSFVLTCAFAPVAGALGYKDPTLKTEGWGTRRGERQKKKQIPRHCAPRDDSKCKNSAMVPGPRDFFCSDVRFRAGRGRPGLQEPPSKSRSGGRRVGAQRGRRVYKGSNEVRA